MLLLTALPPVLNCVPAPLLTLRERASHTPANSLTLQTSSGSSAVYFDANFLELVQTPGKGFAPARLPSIPDAGHKS